MENCAHSLFELFLCLLAFATIEMDVSLTEQVGGVLVFFCKYVHLSPQVCQALFGNAVILRFGQIRLPLCQTCEAISQPLHN